MKVLLLLLLSDLSGDSALVHQRDYVVIANKAVDVESMTIAKINQIYLGFRSVWRNQQRIEAYYPSTRTSLGEKFFDEIMFLTESAFKRHWARRISAGDGYGPIELGSDTEIIEHVSGYQGGIGIISSASTNLLPEDCKVIMLR